MNYKKINIITGWVAFAIALITYCLTVEPTASYWDCGEFIACSYKLEVPHPPGAPFFLLTGRIFSMLAGGDVTMVAFWVNMVSVLSSSFFVLFIFWSITHLAKRILGVKEGEETDIQTILLMGTGMVGALACTFSDSFWFSAVEAEVYGMSAFFTSFVFWAILRWETMSEEHDRARWLILIAYMMGLSIGVHLLNLVALPVLGLIIYFKYYEEVTVKGVLATLAISAAALLLILEGIIPGIPSIVGKIEITFVNSMGLPFGSGALFFIILLLGGLTYGIIYSIKNNKYILNTALTALVFILIGYSSYALVLIRSNYNPPIDENNPEDIMSFVSYLKREQYGSRPLFKGQYFTAKVVDNKKGAPIYMKGKDKYEIKDYKITQKYDPKHTAIFPRMYSSAAPHVAKYREITGLKAGEKPSLGDNLYYLFKHQIGYQYFRYFWWNFVGRESDIQGAGSVLFPSSDAPKSTKENKGRNLYYALPFILGFIGAFFQYRKDPKMFVATALLFFMTGLAIVLYLNTPPIEPRERDYIYAGSFYIFTIWVGFGVLAIFDFLQKSIKNKKALAYGVSVLCLGVPILMAVENWDDHDRSGRYFSVESAKNYLSSCAPNSVLFTGGDNDTFPLWYVQEVEGFRTDVRVIVLSYFNTDWYIDQMTRDAYKSKALPFSLTGKNYQQGGLNDFLPVYERPELKGNAINARSFLKLIKDENKAIQVPTTISAYNSVPAKALFVANIDTNKIKSVLPDNLKPYVTDRMILPVKGRALEKKDLAILDLIVNTNWDRPIYFNNTSVGQISFDLNKYLVQEGLAYRLLPIENPKGNSREDILINTDLMYDNMMNRFSWRSLDNPNVYFTEDYTGAALNSRSAFATLAKGLLDNGEKEKAAQVLKRNLEVIPDESIPFDFYNVQQIDYMIKAGMTKEAKEIAEKVVATSSDQLDYYFSGSERVDPESRGLQKHIFTINEVFRAFRANNMSEEASKYEKIFESYYKTLREKSGMR